MSSELCPVVDANEAHAALGALLARKPHLFAEADELFLGESPRHEPGGVLNYFFVVAACATDGTDDHRAHFRPRDCHERLAVLRAPEKYGLAHVVSNPDVSPSSDRPALIPSLRPQDLSSFEALFEVWREEGSNYAILVVGGTQDLQSLAGRCLRWALQPHTAKAD